jgi:uncharacterized protein (TIGR02722 family)
MKHLFSILITYSLCAGCATHVDRLDPTETTDLSGRWNDSDSRLVSEEMIRDISTRPFMTTFAAEHGQLPVIIVGRVRNLSNEHIETLTFIKELERELINSQRLTFVASSDERGSLREERMQQQEWARTETRKAVRAETGADFMLIGSIKTLFDAENRTTVKFYQVDLELIELETNEKVWIGSKKIKKKVKKPLLRW